MWLFARPADFFFLGRKWKEMTLKWWILAPIPHGCWRSMCWLVGGLQNRKKKPWPSKSSFFWDCANTHKNPPGFCRECGGSVFNRYTFLFCFLPIFSMEKYPFNLPFSTSEIRECIKNIEEITKYNYKIIDLCDKIYSKIQNKTKIGNKSEIILNEIIKMI